MNSQIHQEIIHILHNLIRPRYISHSSPPIHHLTSRNLLQEDHLTTITQLFHGNRAVTHNSINKRTLRVSSPNEIRRIQTKSRKKKKWLVHEVYRDVQEPGSPRIEWKQRLRSHQWHALYSRRYTLGPVKLAAAG